LSIQEEERARLQKELELANKQKEVALSEEMTAAGVEDRGSFDSASKERDPTEGCEAAATELEEQGVNLSPNSKKRKSPDVSGTNGTAEGEGIEQEPEAAAAVNAATAAPSDANKNRRSVATRQRRKVARRAAADRNTKIAADF